MKKAAAGTSIGLLDLLLVLFVGLKLTGYIDWSWWWVLSPILIPLGLVGAFVLIFLILHVVAFLLGVK